jgi:hypothetical protein
MDTDNLARLAPKEQSVELRSLHVVHLLIRHQSAGSVGFLVYPHPKWKNEKGQQYLTLPAKKTVVEHFDHFQQGSSLEHFLDAVLKEDLGVPEDAYVLEQELQPAHVNLTSPWHGTPTAYTIYPLDVWIHPTWHEKLREKVRGKWLTCEEALAEPLLSPTAEAVFRLVQGRERGLEERFAQHPEQEHEADAPRRLLHDVPHQATMTSLARKWLSHNRGGVRHLRKADLDAILAAGGRAFNLRVADPYLRYHLQGIGFTWSFFTHRDPQDLHVHGAPVVEIYGVLEGQLEVWWKPYHDRGTSAWSHRILEAGDWLEVDSLQCHIVHWLGEGKGVVFKAGPGPLAEVGRLGVKGKTGCQCECMKPLEVVELNQSLSKG